jgi:hypothetical protein
MAHQEVLAKFAFDFNATATNSPDAERRRHARAAKNRSKAA